MFTKKCFCGAHRCFLLNWKRKQTSSASFPRFQRLTWYRAEILQAHGISLDVPYWLRISLNCLRKSKMTFAKSRANNVCLNNFVHRMRSPIFLFVQTLSAYWTSAFFWPLMTFYIQYFSYQFLGVLNCHEVSSSLNKFLWFGCGFCLYLYAFCGKRFLIWFIINMRFERYRTLKRVFK